ncbi:hypothetical protein COM86_25145 [Priestia megaterium]|uniref:hypothetical protein n=1 Tax=Priestia TaxID=2800373 RepID=UPI000BEB348C|nr:hypothetical protein [Priestia megaterium]PEB61271.1 hypothetical protein COM86_25145 [Priestia megaterium]PEE77685.1 hypothetical protein COM81_06245 [Priestia megaterium]PFI91848.1 hypothetical protein COI84_20730 [Priestia megaterium]PGR15641.1 hypothetical protein COC62_02600 [Priestia megaterium]
MYLTELLNGVTGFYIDPKNEPPATSLKQFKIHSYEAARTYNGELLECNDTDVHSNFLFSILRISNKEVYVLLNKHYPFVAFASSVHEERIIFVNNKELSFFFSDLYKILYAESLNERLLYMRKKGSVLIKNDNQLNNAELAQIAYWKPVTVGEVLYNYWD